MRGVNLLPVERIEQRRRGRRARRWLVGCAGYGAAVGAAWGVLSFATAGDEAAQAAELAATQARADEDRLDAARVRARLGDTLASLASARAVGGQPDWSLLFAVVAEPLGDEAVLQRCRLEPAPGGYRLYLAGLGRSHAGVLGYARALEQTGLFASVALLETRQEPYQTGQAVAFSIEAVLTGRPEGSTP